MEGEICKNCETEMTGLFCQDCGQKQVTNRPSFKEAAISIFDLFFNIDTGIPHTTLAIFKNPGKVVREFIEGKRIKYVSPFRFLVFWATISFLLEKVISQFSSKVEVGAEDVENMELFARFSENQPVLMTISVLPFLAFTCWFFYRKQGYNYVELLILNTYSTAMLFILSTLVGAFFELIPGIPPYRSGRSLMIMTVIGVTFYLSFFRSKKNIIGQGIKAGLVSFSGWLLIVIFFMLLEVVLKQFIEL